ncbi:hypothetical protein ACNKHW_21355 [Shigella flexneri]
MGRANGGAVPEAKSAVIANAQSKVLIVEFHQPIAARVLEEAQARASPTPGGVQSRRMKSRRSLSPFRNVSRRIHKSEHCAIRINPIAAVKRRCCGFA